MSIFECFRWVLASEQRYLAKIILTQLTIKVPNFGPKNSNFACKSQIFRISFQKMLISLGLGLGLKTFAKFLRVKILWIEMAFTGVPYIALHISYLTQTFWVHLRPSNLSWNHALQIIIIGGRYPYWWQGFNVGKRFSFSWGISDWGQDYILLGAWLLLMIWGKHIFCSFKACWLNSFLHWKRGVASIRLILCIFEIYACLF